MDPVPVGVHDRVPERRLDRGLPTALGVREHPEHQLEVGVTRPHQREPVELGPGQGPLVREHGTSPEPSQLDQRDEALAQVAATFGLEPLVVDVKARLRITDQRLGLEPRELGRARRVLGVGIGRARGGLGQDDPHAIVRRAGGELGSLLVIDDVIGRREQIARFAGFVEVVTETLERTDRGHTPCPIPRRWP